MRITDDQVKVITDFAIHDSVAYMGGKLSYERTKAEYYYLGEARDDLRAPEDDTRSRIISTDVADTIEWMLPALIKIFTASDNVVEFAPQGPEDEEKAKQATDYVNYIFYRQNPGFNLLYTWFKDALLQKNGVLKVWWDNEKNEVREEYRGLSDQELAMLLEDESVEPIEHSASISDDGMFDVHDVVVKRNLNKGRVQIDAVPPEEFLIDRRAKTIKDAQFVAHRLWRTMSDLKAAGYKNVEDIISYDDGIFNSEWIARNSKDEAGPFTPTDTGNNDPSQRTVWLIECYIKIDYNNDGIAEWRKIVRAGNAILENVECDGPPFVSITPIPLPHRFFGLSIADLAISPQRVKTGILRAILDGLYYSMNGRTYAVKNQVAMEDLLTSRPGGVVRVDNPTAVGALNEGRPDIGAGMAIMEYMETAKENRTGWTRYSQGTSADALNQTATGTNIITNRSDMRVELIARVFAETGVKDLFLLILKLVTQHQDRASTIRLNGKWIDVDPSEWKNQFDLTVNVGLGTGNKDQMANQLLQLLQVQKEALQIGVATPQNLFNGASKLAENMGFKNPNLFFTDPSSPEAQQQQSQQPDPAMLEMQMVQQLKQQEFELEKMKAEAKIQLDREKMQAELALEEKKHEDQMMLEREKLHADVTIEHEKAVMQIEKQHALNILKQQQNQDDIQQKAIEMILKHQESSHE